MAAIASTGAMLSIGHEAPMSFRLSLQSRIPDQYANNSELKTSFWHQRPPSQEGVRAFQKLV